MPNSESKGGQVHELKDLSLSDRMDGHIWQMKQRRKLFRLDYLLD